MKNDDGFSEGAAVSLQVDVACPHCGTTSLFKTGRRPALKGKHNRRTDYRCYICQHSTVIPERVKRADRVDLGLALVYWIDKDGRGQKKLRNTLLTSPQKNASL